jgi:hypothetical protein
MKIVFSEQRHAEKRYSVRFAMFRRKRAVRQKHAQAPMCAVSIRRATCGASDGRRRFRRDCEVHFFTERGALLEVRGSNCCVRAEALTDRFVHKAHKHRGVGAARSSYTMWICIRTPASVWGCGRPRPRAPRRSHTYHCAPMWPGLEAVGGELLPPEQPMELLVIKRAPS